MLIVSSHVPPSCALIYIGVGHRKQKSTRNQETHTWMSTCFECKGRVFRRGGYFTK